MLLRMNRTFRNAFGLSKLQFSWSAHLPIRMLTTVTQEKGVRRIVLNNPKKRNALSLEMIETLHQNLVKGNDSSLRCIILSAEGPAFSSGHDLKELTKETGCSQHEKVFGACSNLMVTLQKLPVPVIAQVRGIAAAAGCQLVASCDIVVASEKSTFSTPGATVGLFCSTPGVAVARAVPRKMASYMLLTGIPISADEALKCGLVSKVVPEDQLEGETQRIAEAICRLSYPVIALGKSFFYKQIEMDQSSAYRNAEAVMVNNLRLEEAQEGISAFFQKRLPSWRNAR